MWWALIRKELREIAPYVAAGGVLYLILLVEMLSFVPAHESPFEFLAGMGQLDYSWHRNADTPPFVDESLESGLLLFSIFLTIALGLRQTLGEEGRRTFPVLLHLPFGRAKVILSKLLVGTAVYLFTSLSLIGILAVDSAIPGHYPYPFEWNMVLDSLRIPFFGLLLYVAAFYTGLRQARWYGTRILPGILAFTAVVFYLSSIWLSLALLLSVILISLYLTAIFHESRVRDFR